MSPYRLPKPGKSDPIANLHHYTGNYLSALRKSIEFGEPAHLAAAREVVGGVLGGFADGTYTYEHSQAFNPEVARKLREEALSVLKEGVSADEIKGLEDKLLTAVDEYAIQTGQPERTRAALDAELTALRAERRKQI